MVLFFDRDVGTSLPRALDLLKLPTPIEYHQTHFPIDSPDDEWMSEIGNRGWTLIGHDSRHHLERAELSAIKQYGMGCFYLWGSEAKRWEKALCFLRAYERILSVMAQAETPYIYRIGKTGRLSQVGFP